MDQELRLSGFREPLGLSVRRGLRLAARPELRVEELEFSSRGDRVVGRVVLPAEGSGPHPLVLLTCADAGGADDAAFQAIAGPWAERGLAVASLDLPLQGGRADPKLAAWLAGEPGEARDLPGASGVAADPLRTTLAIEVVRQALIDCERALDALGSFAWLDSERVAYVGFGLGARVGSAFCALDSRPRAVVLGLAGAGSGPPALDPARYVARIAPRPQLYVSAEDDARLPRGSAEALFAAAQEPKQQLRLDAGAGELPGGALDAIWRFLDQALELEAP